MGKVGAIGMYILLYVGFIVVVGLFLSLPVMFLWNGCLVPAAPFLETIGWLQAWGILILTGILFKPTTVNKDD